MNRKQAILLIVPFLLTIVGLGIGTAIKPDRAISYYESKTLAQLPKASELVMGSFFSDFENYWSDQFVARDTFLKLYSYEQIVTGKTKVRNIVISRDQYMIENTVKETDRVISGYANEINALSKDLTGKGKIVFYAPVGYPSSQLESKIPQYLRDDQGDANRERLLPQISDATKIIDVSQHLNTAFTEKQRSEMYFRTDPHWNEIGAYNAFKYIINSMIADGALPQSAQIKDSDFEFTKGDSTRFAGAYNRRMGELLNMYEKVPYVSYKNPMDLQLYVDDNNGALKEGKISDFYATAHKGSTAAYDSAYAMGLSYFRIVNNQALTNKTLVVSRDSFFGAMSLMFPVVFKEIDVIDLRLYISGKFVDIASRPEVNIVLLENSDLTFRNNAVFNFGALKHGN